MMKYFSYFFINIINFYLLIIFYNCNIMMNILYIFNNNNE